MCALSNHIRERPNWWEEVTDKAVVEQWKQEISQQQEESVEAVGSKRLSPPMVKSCHL